MAHAFILMPDRLVGDPMTVFEAVKYWAWDRFPVREQVMRTASEKQGYVEHAHRALWLALATSELHAFVQSPSVGSWFRVPREYWFKDAVDLIDLVESARIPATLERRPGACPIDLIDQPIVFWRADIVATEAQIVRNVDEIWNVFLRNNTDNQEEKIISDDCSEGALPAATDRTGAAGRPSSMHLHIAEMRRRHTAGGLASTLAAEARALADWFAAQPRYADLARPTPRGIENGIRDIYWELKRPTN